jgi:hypothetical protein
MTTQVTEMDDGYADGGYTTMSPPQVFQLPTVTTPDATPDPSITIGAPTSTADMKNVYVYANSINPVSSMGDDPIVAFDVVFSVSCTCPDGTTKTYQVVKRIGVDKMKMAADAESTTPISIVEAKKPNGGYSTSRAKILAGL